MWESCHSVWEELEFQQMKVGLEGLCYLACFECLKLIVRSSA